MEHDLLSAAISIAAGAALGYGLAKVLESLSENFTLFWRNCVTAATQLFNYVTEATKYYLASISQLLEQHWPEIDSYLRQEIGYRKSWLFALFSEGVENYIAFGDTLNPNKSSVIFSVGVPENSQNVQFPTVQDPMITTLVLS